MEDAADRKWKENTWKEWNENPWKAQSAAYWNWRCIEKEESTNFHLVLRSWGSTPPQSPPRPRHHDYPTADLLTTEPISAASSCSSYRLFQRFAPHASRLVSKFVCSSTDVTPHSTPPCLVHSLARGRG
jgi:hypothetical protein